MNENETYIVSNNGNQTIYGTDCPIKFVTVPVTITTTNHPNYMGRNGMVDCYQQLMINYEDNYVKETCDTNLDKIPYVLYDAYVPVTTQLTLKDEGELYPDVIAMGNTGVITGDGSIFNKMNYVDAFKTQNINIYKDLPLYRGYETDIKTKSVKLDNCEIDLKHSVVNIQVMKELSTGNPDVYVFETSQFYVKYGGYSLFQNSQVPIWVYDKETKELLYSDYIIDVPYCIWCPIYWTKQGDNDLIVLVDNYSKYNYIITLSNTNMISSYRTQGYFCHFDGAITYFNNKFMFVGASETRTDTNKYLCLSDLQGNITVLKDDMHLNASKMFNDGNYVYIINQTGYDNQCRKLVYDIANEEFIKDEVVNEQATLLVGNNTIYEYASGKVYTLNGIDRTFVIDYNIQNFGKYYNYMYNADINACITLETNKIAYYISTVDTNPKSLFNPRNLINENIEGISTNASYFNVFTDFWSFNGKKVSSIYTSRDANDNLLVWKCDIYFDKNLLDDNSPNVLNLNDGNNIYIKL